MPPEKKRPICRRCGTCCRKGGPALHADDLPLLRDGLLPRARLVTLRKGEPAFDNVAGRVVTLGREMVKIRDLDSGACPFLDDDAVCRIHDERPLECRLLFCEAPEALEAAYAVNRLTRRDCVNPSGALFELIRVHETRCPAGQAVALARSAAAGEAVAAASLADLVRFDAVYRELLVERAGIDPLELPFLLGRPLPDVLRPLARRSAFSTTEPRS